MTALMSHQFGFDITVIPDGVYSADGDKKARISVVFRPNGKIRGILNNSVSANNTVRGHLKSIGISDEAQDTVVKLLNEDPNALLAPESVLSQKEKDALAAVNVETRHLILAGKDNPIRKELVGELASWLRHLPRHLRNAASATSYFVEEPDQQEPETDPPALCRIEVQKNPSVVIEVPCDLIKKDIEASEGQTISGSGIAEFLGEDGSFNLEALLDSDSTPKRVRTTPHGTTWTREEAQAVWEVIIPDNQLEDLARSILFPTDPVGERTPAQILARDPSKATVRDDGASQLAIAMAELKSQELLASFRSALKEDGAEGFAKGLSPADMVATVFARLLGTVRPFSEPAPVNENFSELDFEGDINDETLALLRQRATIRSLLVENSDPAIGEYRIGDLRPGFETMILEQERARILSMRETYENSVNNWTAAFEGREPTSQLKNAAAPEGLGISIATQAVAEAFSNKPELSLAQKAEDLSKEGNTGSSLRAFAETLGTSAMAWRKPRGQVNTTREDQNAQNAMKRFMEIFAHPVLASAFGLIRDFNVSLDDLPDHASNAFFFSIGAVTNVYLPHNRSAVWIDKSKTGPLAFRPAGRDEWFKGEADEKNGISDLTQTNAKKEPRFILQTLDEQQALRSATLAAQSTAGKFAEGDRPDALDATLPQFRTYGIALMDTWRHLEETDRKAALEASTKRTVFNPLLLFAETLTIGHRTDIGIVQNGKTVWFDAGDRDIEYFKDDDDDSVAPIPEDLSTISNPRAELRERSKSYVTPINRFLDHPDAKQPNGDKSAVVGETADIVAQQTLVTWFGRTLSLPRRAMEDEFSERDWFAPFIDPAESPLPIRMKYHEPEPPGFMPSEGISEGVPPLFEGVEIFFARRPVFLNRGGPRLLDCWQFYDGASKGPGLKLGASGADKALEFGRNEPIADPYVVLTDNAVQSSPAKEPLFYSHNVESPGVDGPRHGENSSYITWWPGNSTNNLVLRAEENQGSLESPDGIEIVERYIVPPRVDITTAELSGLLYSMDIDKTPPGLFEGSEVRQVPWGGGLPIAVGGEEIEDPPEPTDLDGDPLAMSPNNANQPVASGSDDAVNPSRGGVITRDPENNTTRYPWYPDPMATVLCAMPMREGVPLLDEPVRVSILEGDGWPSVNLALVQLLRKDQDPDPQTTFGNEVYEADGLSIKVGLTQRPFVGQALQTIAIWLEDGRECELAIWYATHDAEALGTHGLAQAATKSLALTKKFASLGSESAKARGEFLSALAMQSPLPGLVNHRVLILTSAVRKPLVSPKFRVPDVGPTIPFARLNIADKIREILENNEALDPKQAAIEVINEWLEGKTLGEKFVESGHELHEEGATTILLGGEVDMSRPTTSKFRVEARWEDWTDEITRPARRSNPTQPNNPKDPNFLRPFLPVTKDSWWKLDGMQGPVSNALGLQNEPVALIRDENGAPRCLIHDFLDTRARKIELRVSAISRHSNFFLEKEEVDEFVKHGFTETLVIPATARPAEPVLADDALPIFSEERVSLITNGRFGPSLTGLRIERRTKIRFFLKRPWFDAGEGQKLALLLWDGALFDPDAQSPVSEYSTTPAAIPPSVRPYVSLHGRDPKFASNSLPDFMVGSDILNDVKDERLAHLTLPGVLPKGSGRDDDYRVSAALFPVFLDRKNDVWLAEIALAPRDSYMPFVRLSLSACQTNTKPGLELSRPIEAFGRVPPARAASLTVQRSNGKTISRSLRVTVEGGTYWHRDSGPTLREHASLAHAPWLQVIFLQKPQSAEGDRGWTRADVTQPEPVQFGASQQNTTDHLWDLEIDLPLGWNNEEGADNRAVLIREYELVASDAEGPESHGREPEHDALQIVEAFATSADGLSSIIRGKTQFATLATLREIFKS